MQYRTICSGRMTYS
uniref:Uncharacterized protein n=1 Tax=Anguilla anguilla TaxID=7936 RepID=A0A0E9S0S1_ANGAN